MPRKNLLYICAAAGAFIAITSYAAFVETSVKNRPVVQVETKTLKDEAPSFLPAGKKWKLVWHDEFNGKEIDKTKWMCRESFWGQDFPAFAHNFEGVEMTGKTVRLHLLRKGDDFCSPHLQTGSLTYDIPKDTKGFWPFGKYRKPLFMHKYGYYEIRCRQPKNAGWHSAFWLQAPGVGSSPDPSVCGVETDVMENYRQFTHGQIVGGNGWNGYGKDSKWFGHFAWEYEADADGWCYYGEKAIEYLSGKKWLLFYRGVFIICSFLGAITQLAVVWNFADLMNALMALPNIVSLLCLSGIVAAETKKYLWEDRLDEAAGPEDNPT